MNEKKLETYESIGENWSKEQIIRMLQYWEGRKKDALKQVEIADDRLNWFNYALQKANLKDK